MAGEAGYLGLDRAVCHDSALPRLTLRPDADDRVAGKAR
jgi:hypothetical protein